VSQLPLGPAHSPNPQIRLSPETSCPAPPRLTGPRLPAPHSSNSRPFAPRHSLACHTHTTPVTSLVQLPSYPGFHLTTHQAHIPLPLTAPDIVATPPGSSCLPYFLHSPLQPPPNILPSPHSLPSPYSPQSAPKQLPPCLAWPYRQPVHQPPPPLLDPSPTPYPRPPLDSPFHLVPPPPPPSLSPLAHPLPAHLRPSLSIHPHQLPSQSLSTLLDQPHIPPFTPSHALQSEASIAKSLGPREVNTSLSIDSALAWPIVYSLPSLV